MVGGNFDASFSGSARMRVPTSGLGFLTDQYSLWGRRPVIRLNSCAICSLISVCMPLRSTVVSWGLRDDKDRSFLCRQSFLSVGFEVVLDGCQNCGAKGCYLWSVMLFFKGVYLLI